jgi:hypothetical protein
MNKFIINSVESTDSIFDWFTNVLSKNMFSRFVFVFLLPIIFFIMMMNTMVFYPIKYAIKGE